MPTDIDTTIERVTAYSPSADAAMLRRAYEFADKAHAGQERLTGDPYISHPLAVASILAEIQADPVAITWIFGLKNHKEIEAAFNGRLDEVLTRHFTRQ